MDVTFSDEQRDLRLMVRELLSREAGEGPASTIWKRLSGELGLTGITVPEEHGGAGASSIELGIVLAELGRALTPVPFLQTAVAATALAESGAALAAEVLPAIAAGELVAGLATPGPAAGYPSATRTADGLVLRGTLENVVDGPYLGLLLTPAVVEGATVLAAVRTAASGVTSTTLPTLDRSRPQARIVLDGAAAVELGDAAAASRADDLLLTAVAVESAGAARYCLNTTVEYLGTRVQFGRPVGTFQAVQHRCADLAVLVEAATSTAWYAMWAAGLAAGTGSGSAAVSAPLAKAYCADTFRTVAGEMIQLHGGIGFTWEHPAHRYFKRATSTDLLFGGRAWVRSLVARRAGLAGPARRGSRGATY
ncbi:acyl-CoA dehydrogenase family protein [Pseudonocardia aurantiaca]|uniref:Acyl-CoA dehydrogenase family protein n=1 Tax=Pseudonocardia aurantiaca TaxID=75290 RepID=A0ABW4FT07_9PSEU